MDEIFDSIDIYFADTLYDIRRVSFCASHVLLFIHLYKYLAGEGWTSIVC